MADPSIGYAVMRAIPWDGVEVHGFPMQPPTDGPQRFIPVFDTEEQAVVFASDGDQIMAVKLRPPRAGGQP